jgi:peroxiredoxin family protein
MVFSPTINYSYLYLGGKTSMKRLSIIIRNDGYDQLYTPLTFAYTAAKKGIEVDILFVLWAVRVLTEQGANAVKMSPQHALEEEWFKEQVGRDGDPLSIRDFISMVKQAGSVSFYGCRLAAATFGVEASQLIPEASGIADPLWFLEEKASTADHCQYF